MEYLCLLLELLIMVQSTLHGRDSASVFATISCVMDTAVVFNMTTMYCCVSCNIPMSFSFSLQTPNDVIPEVTLLLTERGPQENLQMVRKRRKLPSGGIRTNGSSNLRLSTIFSNSFVYASRCRT